MQLTPEQQEQLRQAKASDASRVAFGFTAAQKKAWQTAVEIELNGKEENIARFHKIKAAAEQQGFFGDIRRAILLSRRQVAAFSPTIGIDPQTLPDFRAGEPERPSAALNRLVETLGLRLMQEIPR